MSTVHLCDGCGKAVETPKARGLALKRDYCNECDILAEAFEKNEDALRANLYEQFTVNRAALIARYSENSFKLPDVP